MRKALLFLLPIALIILAAVFYKGKSMNSGFMIASSSFARDQPIPRKYTCEGEEIPPVLSWKKVPDKTLSLALIVEDPDAPHGTIIHWVAWNIDPTTDELGTKDTLSAISQGTNSAQKVGYMGPCPPSGQHRYYFLLYALDKKLDLPSSTGKEELINAMKGHILGEAEYMGTYKKEG